MILTKNEKMLSISFSHLSMGWIAHTWKRSHIKFAMQTFYHHLFSRQNMKTVCGCHCFKQLKKSLTSGSKLMLVSLLLSDENKYKCLMFLAESDVHLISLSYNNV
jgi:hypothetical protein